MNYKVIWDKNLQSPIPHKCPVCGGRGLLPSGFYIPNPNSTSGSSTLPVTCKSCGGTGVLWR